jgi:hypothetical protein
MAFSGKIKAEPCRTTTSLGWAVSTRCPNQGLVSRTFWGQEQHKPISLTGADRASHTFARAWAGLGRFSFVFFSLLYFHLFMVQEMLFLKNVWIKKLFICEGIQIWKHAGSKNVQTKKLLKFWKKIQNVKNVEILKCWNSKKCWFFWKHSHFCNNKNLKVQILKCSCFEILTVSKKIEFWKRKKHKRKRKNKKR